MPDVDKILKLVAEGALTPQEADEILSALRDQGRGTGAAAPGIPEPPNAPTPPHATPPSAHRGNREGPPRGQPARAGEHRRLGVDVPARPVRPGQRPHPGAIQSGTRGPILDIGDDDDRVVITSE